MKCNGEEELSAGELARASASHAPLRSTRYHKPTEFKRCFFKDALKPLPEISWPYFSQYQEPPSATSQNFIIPGLGEKANTMLSFSVYI